MPVLTITSRKGGCGKTTLCTALAAALAAEGEPLALLDTDPNATASRWASTIQGPAICAYAEADAERLRASSASAPSWPGTAADETATLLAELRALTWLPAKMKISTSRKGVNACPGSN